MLCMRITERAIDNPPNGLDVMCPNEAEDEVTVVVNNLPWSVPMCTFHKAEYHQKFAEARNRRNERNRQVAQQRDQHIRRRV